MSDKKGGGGGGSSADPWTYQCGKCGKDFKTAAERDQVSAECRVVQLNFTLELSCALLHYFSKSSIKQSRKCVNFRGKI